MFFTGEFRHSIDAKGRLIVPSKVRDALDNGRVMLTVGEELCISLWSGDGLERLSRSLLEQDRTEEEVRRAIRQMAGKGHVDTVDKQGRITIPQHLRHYAGIDKDVVIVGMLDHAEIWSPERYAEEELRQAERPMADRIKDLKS